MDEHKLWLQGICNLQQVTNVLSFAKTADTPPSNEQILPGCQRVEIFTGGKIQLEDREFGRGTILWHSPGDRLNYFCDPAALFSCVTLVFKVKDDRHLMPRISRWDPDSPISVEDFFLESRKLYFNSQNDFELLAFYLGTILLRQICLRPAINPDACYSSKMKIILRMFTYEDPEVLSIKAISAKTGISISHIHYLFNRELNCTPHHYILRKRMLHAQTLLQSNCPIKDIALRCGFQRTEAFYKAFHAAFRITPGDYRKQNGNIRS
ncbi:MAG: helix-turn-helix transcriptional regulator [Lentisphaerae bacterium]|nr:helix-turn-helix transcriptional regulator [Lentisphaerota bacterium]